MDSCLKTLVEHRCVGRRQQSAHHSPLKQDKTTELSVVSLQHNYAYGSPDAFGCNRSPSRPSMKHMLMKFLSPTAKLVNISLLTFLLYHWQLSLQGRKAWTCIRRWQHMLRRLSVGQKGEVEEAIVSQHCFVACMQQLICLMMI